MKKEFDFIGHRKVCAIISACLLVACLLCTLLMGVKMDISFKGGSLLKFSYTGDLNKDDLLKTVETKLKEPASVDLTVSGELKIANISTTQVLTLDEQEAITDALSKAFPKVKFETLGMNALEPAMGQRFFVKCILAVVLASLFLVIYIGLRFRKIGGLSASLFAVMALLNDMIIAYFAFVIFRFPLNDNFVAVLLTILGYSLNDTIVIYDRIRENRRKMGADTPIGAVVNQSINQSFVRTMNTSITTVLALGTVAVLALVFNMESIISLVVPMLIGVLSGFYTSVCLCSPLWAVWIEHKEKKNAAQKNAVKTAAR